MHGWDLSLNHAGFIELTGGELSYFTYVTDRAASATRSKFGFRIEKLKGDRQVMAVARLSWLKEFIRSVIETRRPEFIGIEDYALRAAQGAHQIGELGGMARLLCYEHGIPFRLHDPTSVKMFVTHDGTAQKDLVEQAVDKRWGRDFSSLNPPPGRGKPNRQTSQDLADAYGIAQLVWTELQLRRAELTISELHEKEIRVFNRITKAYPTNLLDRDWIQSAERDSF